jgi:hypothetical protein
MLGFSVEKIYVVFEDQVLQQAVDIPMVINCAPLLADLILYPYEAEYIQTLLRDKKQTNLPCRSTGHQVHMH